MFRQLYQTKFPIMNEWRVGNNFFFRIEIYTVRFRILIKIQKSVERNFLEEI